MNEPGQVAPPHAQVRLAGAIYAVVVVCGMFSLGYAPGQIFAGDNNAEIVRSISAHQDLLRLSIVAELTCYVAFLILPLALYRFLAPAGQFAAMAMVALATMSVPLGFAGVAHLLDIVRLVDGGAPITEASVMAALESYRSGMRLLAIPWGLWLIPFGWLVIRSRYTPSIVGILLILAGVGYVANFLGGLLIDNYTDLGVAQLLKAPRLAEVVICVWMLVFGARSLTGMRRSKA